MEVSESEWKKKASENITRYLHRGGNCQGDVPQLLSGSSLLNTIGVAMNLPMRDPSDWSTQEMKQALANELVYFEGDARNVIDVIAKAIYASCGGDKKNFITVLPIELYFDRKLYELPLFKIKRYKDSDPVYIDNIGRSYDSHSDWSNNNKLPPCEIAYPFMLRLTANSLDDYATIQFSESPAAGALSKVTHVVDVGAAVTGLGASVGLLFVTGGLATPLVLAAAGTAVWGTGRTGYQLIDKASHGESINPFTDSSSRMLWLGLAANIASFGAMGASMRLATMAARGRNISTAFTIFVDVVNGTSVALSSLAMIDTTIYLCEHYDNLSAFDILMHTAAMAFWTKGLFTYKSSSTIMTDARNQAFKHIYSKLTPEQRAEMKSIRNQWQNDANLLARFHNAGELNISPKDYALILIDAKKIMNNLNTNDAQTFMTIRDMLKNDIALMSALREIGSLHGISTSEAAQQVVKFWQKTQQYNLPTTLDVRMSDSGLVIGSAPAIRISQLPQLSNQMVQFVSQQLSIIDVKFAGDWASSIEVLLSLQEQGMFSVCPVISIIPKGRAVVNLKNSLYISIYKLQSIPRTDLQLIFSLINDLPTNIAASKLPKELKRLGKTYLLKFECQRREALANVRLHVEDCRDLLTLIGKDLQNHERDRLITFVDNVENSQAKPYIKPMMAFVESLRPRNISEMVAYSEFAVQYVEKYKTKLIAQNVLPDRLPRGVRPVDWLRAEGSRRAFAEPEVMVRELAALRQCAAAHDMAGARQLGAGLADAALATAVQAAAARGQLRFGSELSAAYHVYKHGSGAAAAEYVARANACVGDAACRATAVRLMQDGDARRVDWEGPRGTASVLEREGRVWLCTFTPLERAPAPPA